MYPNVLCNSDLNFNDRSSNLLTNKHHPIDIGRVQIVFFCTLPTHTHFQFYCYVLLGDNHPNYKNSISFRPAHIITLPPHRKCFIPASIVHWNHIQITAILLCIISTSKEILCPSHHQLIQCEFCFVVLPPLFLENLHAVHLISLLL